MLLQVHDELVFEVAEGATDEVIARVRAVMEGAAAPAVRSTCRSSSMPAPAPTGPRRTEPRTAPAPPEPPPPRTLSAGRKGRAMDLDRGEQRRAAGGRGRAQRRVWLLYLHLFLTSYRRQQETVILIHRGASEDDRARCIVSNMGSEPIYVSPSSPR
jgi:hypothetical protein